MQTVLKANDVQYMMDVLLREVKAEFISRYNRVRQLATEQEIDSFLLLHEQEIKQRVCVVTRDTLFTLAMNEVDDREAVIAHTRQAFGALNLRLRQRLQASLCRN